MENNYREFVKENLDIYEPLFNDARNESEFEFILSLLAIRGVYDTGWDPYENTQRIFNDFLSFQSKLRGSLRGNVSMWTYAHLLEASEHYELLSNLVFITKGGQYRIKNLKPKNPRFANMTVKNKIKQLKEIASETPYNRIHTPFESAFDSTLRNAVYHADYSFKGGAVTLKDGSGKPKIYEPQQVLDLHNRSLALHEVLSKLRKSHIASYDRPSTILSSKEFGDGKPIPIKLIIRKNHGVIGIRGESNSTDMGKPFEFSLYSCLPSEKPLIEAGETYLPTNRIEITNKILDKLPRAISRKVVKHLDKGSNTKRY